MSFRITIGTEHEYGIMPDGGLTATQATNELFKHIRREMARNPNLWVVQHFMNNGAKLYPDMNHPEYAGPTCTDPWTAAESDHTGAIVVSGWAKDLWRTADSLGLKGRHFRIYRNNHDSFGHTYGTHENYGIPRSANLSAIIEGLTPFMVSRPVCSGSGRLFDDPEHPYGVSQRSEYLSAASNSSTTNNLERPLINTRDQPHADPARYRRLHVIGADVNMSETQTLHKVGSTALVIAYLLRYGRKAFPSLKDVRREIRSVGADPSLKHKMVLNDEAGTTMTAVQMQRLYFNVISAMVEQDGFEAVCEPQQGRLIMQIWDRMLTGLETDYRTLSPIVDWVRKLELLEEYLGTDRRKFVSAKAKLIDLRYHDARPEVSLAWRDGRLEKLFDDRKLLELASAAPSGTRDEVRSILRERFGEKVTTMDWDYLTIHGQVGSHHVHQSIYLPSAEPDYVEPLLKQLRQVSSQADTLQVLENYGCFKAHSTELFQSA